MKQVYSYQEMVPLVEQGQTVVFTAHLRARVKIVPFLNGHVAVTITLSRGDTHLGTVEQEYASIEDVLDAYDIDVHAPQWEVIV